MSEPAFPAHEIWTDNAGNVHREWRGNGLTKREWFAGQALIMLPHMGCGADLDTYDTARAAYQIADAMIAASKEGEKP